MAISTKAAKKFAENCVPQSLNLFTFQFRHHTSADAAPVVALRMHKSIFAAISDCGHFCRNVAPVLSELHYATYWEFSP